MKKIIFIVIAAMYPLFCQSQSDSLKTAYRQVCSTLKDYKFESEDAHRDHGKTKSITLKIQNGNFIFSFNDDFGNFADPFFGFRHGMKTIKVPILELILPDGRYWLSEVSIEGRNGVELSYKGKKEILRNYGICGEELSLKKLLKELQLLKEICINEGFQGTLGGGATPKKTVAKTTSTPVKKTTPQPQQKQRKSVPAGN